MEENERQIKSLISRTLEKQLEQMKHESEKENNSFLFLEGHTLEWLLLSLLNTGKANEDSSEAAVAIPQELFDLVSKAKSQNKKEFEDIMKLLRKDS